MFELHTLTTSTSLAILGKVLVLFMVFGIVFGLIQTYRDRDRPHWVDFVLFPLVYGILFPFVVLMLCFVFTAVVWALTF